MRRNFKTLSIGNGMATKNNKLITFLSSRGSTANTSRRSRKRMESLYSLCDPMPQRQPVEM